jgi:hypothetical protein
VEERGSEQGSITCIVDEDVDVLQVLLCPCTKVVNRGCVGDVKTPE